MYKEYLQKLEKLKGTELKGSKRIDLGIIDDLEGAIEKLDNLRDGAYSINKGALVLKSNVNGMSIKRLVADYKEGVDAANNHDKYVDKAEGNIKSAFNALAKSVAELGISIDKLPVYKKYEKSRSQLKEIDGFVKDAKSILSKIE